MTKPQRTATEIAAMLSREARKRLPPLEVMGLAAHVFGQTRDKPEAPNWNADAGRWARTIKAASLIAWSAVVSDLQKIVDLKE